MRSSPRRLGTSTPYPVLNKSFCAEACLASSGRGRVPRVNSKDSLKCSQYSMVQPNEKVTAAEFQATIPACCAPALAPGSSLTGKKPR